MSELITVIINVYNNEKFIAKCIESVINQTYKNLEILIINDGSTDNTLKICKRYKDPRIKIITTKNKGLSLSRNIGIDKAKGDYLYFVDSDDYIENDSIEYLYNLCKKYNVDLSTCRSLTIFDYDFTLIQEKEIIEIISSKEMLRRVLLSENETVTIWNKLIKKELFDDIRFENRIINDIVVTYKLAIKTPKVAYSNQKKYYYLKHKNAITVSKKGENINRVIDYYNAIIERHEYVKNIYPNFLENDMALLIGLLYIFILDNDEIQLFLKEKEADKLFKKYFSFKMMFGHTNNKEKTKLLLFRINPRLYQILGNLYRKKKYTYKY